MLSYRRQSFVCPVLCLNCMQDIDVCGFCSVNLSECPSPNEFGIWPVSFSRFDLRMEHLAHPDVWRDEGKCMSQLGGIAMPMPNLRSEALHGVAVGSAFVNQRCTYTGAA